MHLRSLLLGSAALAALPMFSPADMGGGASAIPVFQSYDPDGQNYVTAEVASALTLAGHVILTEPPAPAVAATLETAAVAQPVSLMPAEAGTDADRIAALEARVSALETSPNAKAGEVLAWAEKVLTKYYSNPNDKPEPDLPGRIVDAV